jgi:hypothetical protein
MRLPIWQVVSSWENQFPYLVLQLFFRCHRIPVVVLQGDRSMPWLALLLLLAGVAPSASAKPVTVSQLEEILIAAVTAEREHEP